MSSIGGRTGSSRGSKRGPESVPPTTDQADRVLSSNQRTIVRALARQIAREEFESASGIGDVVHQLVGEELEKFKSQGSSETTKDELAKIITDLQFVEEARKKKEDETDSRLVQLEARESVAGSSVHWTAALGEANKRIESMEQQLVATQRHADESYAASVVEPQERITALERRAKSGSLSDFHRLTGTTTRLEKLEQKFRSLDEEMGRLLDNFQPLPIKVEQQNAFTQGLTNSLEDLRSQIMITQGQTVLLLRNSRKAPEEVPRGTVARRLSRDSHRSRYLTKRKPGARPPVYEISDDEQLSGTEKNSHFSGDEDEEDRRSLTSLRRTSRHHGKRSVSPHSGLGPRHTGLADLKPNDPRFGTVVSYRRYRLRNPDDHRGRSVSDKIGVYSRQIRPFMKDLKFSGDDPITILAFLTKLKTQLDHNRISEGAALSIIPDYLENPAREDYLRLCDLGDDVPGAFDSYLGAVQYLLRTYAKDAYLEDPLIELDNVRQEENERERDYSSRLMTAVYRLAGAISESEPITRFIRGCRPDVRSALRTVRAENPSRSYGYFVERAAGFCDTHRALAQPSSRKKDPTAKRTDRLRQVDLVEAGCSSSPRKVVPDRDAIEVK